MTPPERTMAPGAPEPPFELIRSGPSDRYFDYCLQPYQPRRSPHGKLRSENLLLKALEISGLLERAQPLIDRLRGSLGRDMVVWGTKFDGEHLFFELYVYDPQRQDPCASVSGLQASLANTLPLLPSIKDTIPIMMVSFDLDQETFERGNIAELNLYLSGTDEHEGRSYTATTKRLELANTYRFLDPKADIDTLLRVLESSCFIDYTDPRTLSRVLMPELFACKRVCVAKKRHRDGVYYSGIAIDQLLWFLQRFDYPKALFDFASELEADLEHLYFDVGLDLRQDEAGAIHFPKTSFYGTF